MCGVYFTMSLVVLLEELVRSLFYDVTRCLAWITCTIYSLRCHSLFGQDNLYGLYFTLHLLILFSGVSLYDVILASHCTLYFLVCHHTL